MSVKVRASSSLATLGEKTMTISEHLIENALCQIEKTSYNTYEDFMSNKLLKKQAEKVGISMTDLWYIAQYVYYTYRPEVEYKVKEKYGFDIDEIGENK